ncbi:MAG: hypothetical protein ACREOW_03320 [Thermodesulfobacteriota bacterium]
MNEIEYREIIRDEYNYKNFEAIQTVGEIIVYDYSLRRFHNRGNDRDVFILIDTLFDSMPMLNSFI